jgi:hypothetical protein
MPEERPPNQFSRRDHEPLPLGLAATLSEPLVAPLMLGANGAQNMRSQMPPAHWNAAKQKLDRHPDEILRRHPLDRTGISGEDRQLVFDDISDESRVCPLPPGVIIERDRVVSAPGRDPP